MELTGTVTLDDETMKSLKIKIREEVVEEMKEKGIYFSEIKKFLDECDYKEYMSLINLTINQAVAQTDKESIRFTSDEETFRKMLAIQAITKI